MHRVTAHPPRTVQGLTILVVVAHPDDAEASRKVFDSDLMM